MANLNKALEAKLSELVSTKGTRNLVGEKSKSTEVIVGKDSPVYYLDEIVITAPSDFSKYEIKDTNRVLQVRNDALADKDLIREEGVKLVDRKNYADLSKMSLALPINAQIVAQICRINNISVVNELIAKGCEFYLERDCILMRDGNQMFPLLSFMRDFNNIAKLYKNEQFYYFIDGFTTKTMAGPVKDMYVNELFLTELLRLKTTGKANLHNRISSTLVKPVSIKVSARQLFNYFIYKTQTGFISPANTYVTQIGGDTNRDSWVFDTKVTDKLQGNVCWILEGDRASIATTEEVSNYIFSNPCVVQSSASQGTNFVIMASEQDAMIEDRKYTDPKFNVTTTMLISMKMDKGIIRKNVVFCNIDNGSDNNNYGNSLWQEDYAGKIYACDKNEVPVRVKWSSGKAYTDYQITGEDGNPVDNWVIAPAYENSNETFEFEEKTGTIKQLLHMGYQPEPMTIVVNGETIKTMGFRDVPFYIDPTTSSDYNADPEKKFDTKLYSTMISCIYSHMETEQGGRGEVFMDNIRKAFDSEKASDVLNIAKFKIHKISLGGEK